MGKHLRQLLPVRSLGRRQRPALYAPRVLFLLPGQSLGGSPDRFPAHIPVQPIDDGQQLVTFGSRFGKPGVKTLQRSFFPRPEKVLHSVVNTCFPILS